MIFGVDAFYECELWTYWGDMKPMHLKGRFAIPPQEGDDIIIDGQQYTVMRRRIEDGKRLRLYVALDDDRPDTKEAAE